MKLTMFETDFEISEPYAEGHVVTAVEAKVLNQTRKENISNSLRKAIGELIGAGKEKTQEAIDAAIKLVSDLDAEYGFSERAASGGRRVMNALEKECRAIAKAHLVKQLAAKGVTLAAFGKEAAEAKITEWSINPKVIAAAERAIAARDKLSFDDI